MSNLVFTVSDKFKFTLLAQLSTTSQILFVPNFSLAFFICCRDTMSSYNKHSNEGQQFLQKVLVHNLFIGLLHDIGSMHTNMGCVYGSTLFVLYIMILEPIGTPICMVLVIVMRDTRGSTKLEVRQLLLVMKVMSMFVIIA